MKITRTVSFLLATMSMAATARMIDIEDATDLRKLYWAGHQLDAQVLGDIYVTADTDRLHWKTHPIITSVGGVDCTFYTYEPDISMTFDGAGASVHEVFRYGRLEFYYLSELTFKNIHNKYFALAGGAATGTITGYGGVLNGVKGGVFSHGGISFNSIGSVTFDNIEYDASQWGTDEFYVLTGAALYTQDGDSVSFTSVNDVTINNVGISHESQFVLDSGRNFRGKGGAVYTHNMLIENTTNLTVTNNYIYKKYQQGTISGQGGAFHLKDNSLFTNIYDADFSGNYVKVANEAQGGAIYLDHKSSLTINECVQLNFDGNYVKVSAKNDDTLSGTPDIMAKGGAVSLCNEASFIVENNVNVSFSGNYAEGTDLSGKSKQELHVGGGAIFAGNDATVRISRNADITFSNNSVTANNSQTSSLGLAEGGAIAIGENSTLELDRNDTVTFSGNTVTGDVSTIRGGAISAGAGSHISLTRNDGVVFSNNAVTGGMGSAIYTEGTLEMDRNDVTFSGNEGYAVYMVTAAKSSSTPHLKMTTGDWDTILFDGDKLYACSTSDSTPLSVLINGEGNVIFRGSHSGATIENGSVSVDGGRLVLEGGASFRADELKIAAGATLAAAGSGNSVSGILTMTDAQSVFSLVVGGENLCTAGQDGTFTGNAVVNLDGTFNLSQDSLTFNVLLNDDVTGTGVYQLLELGTAINQDMWTDSRINVTGDVLFSDLRWNDAGTKLFYARVADGGHLGDRTWTNIAGSGNWNFNARNWKLTGAENNGAYDGILYVDSYVDNSNETKVGVHFTDECTSAAVVNITTTVTPRDITVNATRDYTFADGGGTISGEGKLIKEGSGELTIALNNDFTGGVELSEGTIRVQADDALGKGAVKAAKDTTLIFENNVTSTLATSGSYIFGDVEIAAGSTLNVDLDKGVSYGVYNQTIDGTLRIVGSNKTFGSTCDSYNTAPSLSGNGKYAVQGSNLTGYFGSIAAFGGDMEILGENNTVKVMHGAYNGSGGFSLIGSGNRLEFVDQFYDYLSPLALTEGGRLSLSGGSTVKASKVTIGDGAVMEVAGKGNTIETNFDPYTLYNNVLWLGANGTLDITISAENAISKTNDEAVLNTPFLMTEENNPYRLFVRADMGSAFEENTSYVLMYLNDEVYYYVGDNNEYWNPNMVHVMGDAVFEDLAWEADNYKLVFNAPDAVVWRDSAGTGVWNADGDKNWKRFIAAGASVFYNGDNVRFTDTCTSDAAVSVTEEITPGSILVRADRDYTFADGGGTISGDGKLTKQGRGELTIALDNEFSGGVQLDEGTLRLQADKALGSGKLTMADGTSLVVENGTDVALATDGNVIKGNVSIARDSGLQISSDSTYAAASTTVDGSLKIGGNFRSGSTDVMSGSGSIVMNGTGGSAEFKVAKSEGFTGNIIVQGKHNKLDFVAGGYEGSGMLVASGQGAEINFEGQDVIIKDSGLLFVNEEGKFVAENVTLSEYATLVATNTDTIFDSNTGVPAMTPMEKYVYDLYDYVSSGSIEATNFTLEGGTLYVQERGFLELRGVKNLVFDASNGESFTLATTFQAYQEGDMLYYLLFTDVAQYSVNGDMVFYVDSEERTEQATLVAVENKFFGTTLFLRTKVVPEPSSAALCLLSLTGLALRRRRR